ncbi:MAG TPA: PAS domain-containing protein [Anaerolineales bacterium]|nr:PAS domain-containing protein [Anaerolineales bacterium]
MSLANVLIVEVNISTAYELKRHLERFGYSVVGTAYSGSEAIEMIGQAKPDIILMSVRLNGTQDGIKAGSLIQKVHDLPIVYMIDQNSQATIRRAGTTGPFGYIFRPFDEKQIFATIDTALLHYQLEKKLQQSRQWLNTTLTSLGDGVIATDEHGRIRFINPTAVRLTGWQHEAAIEKPLYEVFSLVDETSREVADIEDRLHKEDSKQGFEGRLRSVDGSVILIEGNVTSIEDGKGNVYGTVLVFRDITHQREATLEMERQAARAQALVQAASEINAQHDLETVLHTICEITNRTLKATGTAVFLRDLRRDTFRGMATFRKDQSTSTCRENRFELPRDILQSLLTRENPVIVIQDIQEHAELRHFNIYEDLEIKTLAIAALFQGGELLGALISIFAERQHFLPEDEFALLRGLADQASSAIKNAELFEQVRAGRERQRKLSKSLVDIQEAERRHIAQELHDHLGQVLTGLQFMLENTKKQITGPQRSSLEEIQQAVSDVIGQVREMSLNLRPSMLDDMGLLPTLYWHLDRYTSQTGIRVDFQCVELPERFPPEIETAAYRIIQEALTNVARYAQVTEVFVGLVVQEKTLWLEVLDKGKGFDSSADLDRPTSGLGGMRERASLVGGYLTVRTFIDQGTQILAALPLTEKPLERRRYDRNRTSGR